MRLAARPTAEVVEQFVLSKIVSGCSPRTIQAYRFWFNGSKVREDGTKERQGLIDVAPTTDALDAVVLTKFFADLRARGVSASTLHQALRTTKAFVRWLMATGQLRRNPLTNITIRPPKTFPHVPAQEHVEAVLAACTRTPEGCRNYAMILLMADGGLRASEVLGLLIEDWRDRTVLVRLGKGGKDRVVPIEAATVRAIKKWLTVHPSLALENYLFVTMNGCRLKHRAMVQVLHRLSARAGLSVEQRISPHGLRHFSATPCLANRMGLEYVRRKLGHASLAMTLRYSHMVPVDLQEENRRAGAINRLRLPDR